ncbi:MAG: MFS transporter [Anaerolineae bacterium]
MATDVEPVARRQGASSRFPPWVRPFLVLLCVTFFGQMTVAPGQSLLSVYVESVLHRGPTFTSALVSTQLVLGAVASIVGGTLADSHGRRRAMLLGATGLPFVGVIFLSRNAVLMLVLWAYIGFALAIYILGRQAYLMAVVPPRRLGVAFAVLFTGVTMGAAAGNLVAAALVRDGGFRMLGLTAMAAALVVIVALAATLREPSPAVAHRNAVKGGYWAMLHDPKTLLLASLQTLPTVYYGAASLLMPLLIFRASGRPEVSAYYATATLVCASVGQLLAGRIMDRRGGRGALVALVAGVAATSLLTAFLTDSLVGLFACGVVGITLAWALSVAYPVLVSDFYPVHEHGRTLGLLYFAWSVGMLVGTQAGGLLVGVSAGLPFLAIGLAGAAAIGLALLLVRRPGAPRPGEGGAGS